MVRKPKTAIPAWTPWDFGNRSVKFNTSGLANTGSSGIETAGRIETPRVNLPDSNSFCGRAPIRVFRQLMICVAALLHANQAIAQPTTSMALRSGTLPKHVSTWSRPDAAQIVDASNIFEYMNGAGELYLSYGFNHVEVFEYTSPSEADILVEIYHMTSPDESFGLLSLDWSGEAVDLQYQSAPQKLKGVAPADRALYGAGLLRLCAGNLFARILAYAETPVSREAVMSLGEAIVADQPANNEPALLKLLHQDTELDWRLRRDRVAYFHSHLVLQSLYYLSHENILGLDRHTQGLSAVFEREGQDDRAERAQLLVLQYASPERAEDGLNSFLTAYIPERTQETNVDIRSSQIQIHQVDGSWLGFRLDGDILLLLFDSPDEESAQAILEHIQE